MPVSPPTGLPLVGRVVRLDAALPDDAEGLHAVLSVPVVYTQGYVMRPAPADLAETCSRLETDISARPAGRTAYTVRLVADGALGAAGTVVGTSSLGDLDLGNERAHLGWTLYGSRWWGTAVNPEVKLLLLAHAFEDCGFGRVKNPDRPAQPALPGRHRQARRHARGGAAPAHPPPRRDLPRHRRLQHPARGVARGACAASVPCADPGLASVMTLLTAD